MSIKTWQTRWEIGLHKDDAMQAEIDELRAALNGTELFEQSFLYQKGKIERLESQLQERDAEIERLTAMPFASEAVRAFVYGKKIDAQRKVLEQALDALKNAPVFGPRSKQHKDAITAIQEQLK